MNNRGFSIIKKYSWILLVCVVLGAVGGFLVGKSQTQVFQATSTVVVEAGAAGTLLSTTTVPQINVTESSDETTLYTTEIQGSAVMQFVYTMDPSSSSGAILWTTCFWMLPLAQPVLVRHQPRH